MGDDEDRDKGKNNQDIKYFGLPKRSDNRPIIGEEKIVNPPPTR